MSRRTDYVDHDAVLASLAQLEGVRRAPTSEAEAGNWLKKFDRNLEAAYDAAQTTDRNARQWRLADILHADEANSPIVRQTLRSRSRYECLEGNSYAKGMVHTLSMDLVGRGPKLQLQTEDRGVNSEIERSWHQWARRIRLARKMQTMRVAKCVDGETFGEMVLNRNVRHEVKLDLRVSEADQYASPMPSFDPTRMIDGMEFDEWGDVQFYHRLKYHPGQPHFDFGFDRVPASQVIHLYRQDRPGQHRGIPEVTTALPLFSLLREYSLAVLSSARSAAKFTAVMETMAAAVNADGQARDPSVQPYDMVDIDYDMITALPFGWKMNQFDPKQPVDTHAEFVRTILTEIARCIHMPLMIAQGDAAEHNYSSGRLDVQTYQKAIEIERAYWEAELLDRLLEEWFDEAVLTGVIPDGFGSFEEIPHQWIWDNRQHVDPEKEANAQAVRLDRRLTTLADEYAREGQDWEVQLRQIARERELIQDLGLDGANGDTQQETEAATAAA